MDLSRFTLSGPEFLIVDAAFLPSKEDGLVVKAPSGSYVIQAKVIAYGCDRRISRLRAVLDGFQVQLGDKIGETWTDTATTAICDLRVFSEAWGDDDDASYAKIEEALDNAEAFGVAVLSEAAGAVAPFVSSGFGDGTFPVFQVVKEGKRVGFEVEFIAENTPYAFDEPSGQPTIRVSNDPESDKSGDMMGQLLKQLGQALKPSGEGSKPLSREEQKSKMAEVFQHFEKELLGDAAAAAAEFREHLRQVRSKATPPTAKFRQITEDAFPKTPDVQDRVTQLHALGFRPIGVFLMEGASGGKLAAFLHPDLRVYCTLNSSANDLICEFNVDYPDGTTFSAIDSTKYSWLAQPPWRTVVRKDLQSLKDLLDLFLRNLPQQERPPASAASFEAGLTPGTNRDLLWRKDRGGLTQEEFRAAAQKRNPTKPVTPEWLLEKRLESADKALFSWLCLQGNLPFRPENAMDSLIIIHDELTPSLLANAFWCGTNDFKVREEAFWTGTPREAFERVNTERGSKLLKIMSKRTGLAADYYMPANSPVLKNSNL